MENTQTKIIVESRVNGSIGLSVPDLRLKKRWEKKGQKVAIDRDVLREAIYEPGVEYLFQTGSLYIEKMEDKIFLGLEEEGTSVPTKVIALTEQQIMRLLKIAPVAELKEFLSKASLPQREELVDYAIKNEITELSKCDLLKQATGRDVLQAVKLSRANKEEIK